MEHSVFHLGHGVLAHTATDAMYYFKMSPFYSTSCNNEDPRIPVNELGRNFLRDMTGVEYDVDDEASKSGVAPAATAELAAQIATLDNVRLRGLMTIPAPAEGLAAQRRPFARLRELRDALNADGFALDTLSMGMSADLEAAVAEGATHVRVGTAVFGPRTR